MSKFELKEISFTKHKGGGHQKRLTLEERKQIQGLLKKNPSISAHSIAKLIGRSKNALVVELRRNGRETYSALKAHKAAEAREAQRLESGRNTNKELIPKLNLGFKKRIENLEMQVEILVDTIKTMRK